MKVMDGGLIMSSDSRHTNFVTQTYVEDRERVEHLASLVMNGFYNVCWVIHDRDIVETGDDAKPHCMAVVHLQNGMTISAFAKKFAIRDRLVRRCKKGEEIADLDAALLYMIHADEDSRIKGKFQYSVSDIKGPMAEYARSRITELLDKRKSKRVDEAESFLTVKSYIESNLYMTMSEVSQWAASNGHWSSFRRSASIFRDIIKEHNQYLRELDIKRERARWQEELEHRADEQSVYEAVGYRALRTLDMLLEQAGRPSMKLKRQISYIDEVVGKSKGKVNVELIKEMLRDGEKYVKNIEAS